MPKVSVVIPVWNATAYLQQCLESVFAQTYDDFEIVVVDDGSTDGVENLLRGNQRRATLRWVRQENAGQGAARNVGLAMAEGEYVLFLDADDMIEPMTLELAVARMEADASDVVVFDWKYLLRSQRRKYDHQSAFFGTPVLRDAECERLLKVKNIFSVTALYRREFLVREGIRYLEGAIYEDNPFWVRVALKASVVSTIHSPLYTVRVRADSTTKSGFDTHRHARDFICAVRASVQDFKPRNPHAGYWLYKYFREKYLLYYMKRVPPRYRPWFAYSFAREISRLTFTIPKGRDRSTALLQRIGFFHGRFKSAFWLLTLERAHALRKDERRQRQLAPGSSAAEIERIAAIQTKYSSSVLFLGFDGRYTGNSRYLFEEYVSANTAGLKVFFATDDERVPEELRATERGDDLLQAIRVAKVVVLESWSPPGARKGAGQTWIQLWHGTPIKRMLFDSAEPEIIRKRPTHKNAKYADTRRWSTLVADAPAAAGLFKTAFLIGDRVAVLGYPRVEYILNKRNDTGFRSELRARLGVREGRKVLLYAPTWRDYNYGKKRARADFSYLIDPARLAQALGDEWLVAYKDHEYMPADASSERGAFSVVNDWETQELLLVADCLLTDYSSIVFDALAIDLPSVLYASDLERYQASRGLYEEVWEDLQPLVACDESDAISRINACALPGSAGELKQKYCYTGELPSAQRISGLIDAALGARRRVLLVATSDVPYAVVRRLCTLGSWLDVALVDGPSSESVECIGALEGVSGVHVVETPEEIAALVKRRRSHSIVAERAASDRIGLSRVPLSVQAKTFTVSEGILAWE